MNGRYKIREATPDDADAITNIFQTIYDSYQYDDYTDPSRLRKTLLSNDSTKVFVIELVPGQVVAKTHVPSPRVVGTGSVSFTCRKHVASLTSAAILPQYQGLECDGQSAYEELLTVRLRHAHEAGAAVVQTEANSSKHAKTQHQFNKHGFVPVGILRGRYPEAFTGHGRESVVVMIDPNSRFQRTSSQYGDSPDLYIPSAGREFVEKVLSDINTRRNRDPVKRTVIDSEQSLDRTSPGFTKCVVSRHIDAGSAEYKVLSGGELRMDELYAELNSVSSGSDIDHVSVTFNGNEPSTAPMAAHLLENGFSLAAFVPGGFCTDSGSSGDLFALQYTDYSSSNAQLLNRVVSLVGLLNIEYDVIAHDEPVEGVDRVRI